MIECRNCKKQLIKMTASANSEMQMERAFIDYWRVFLSMTWTMQQRGVNIWYPNDQDNTRAQGIFSNVSEGRIPHEKMPEMMAAILAANPYTDGMGQFLRDYYSDDPQTQYILNYFDI